jgi:hypothetical protein
LQDFVKMSPGDYVIQNAANSAVGRLYFQRLHTWTHRGLYLIHRPSGHPDCR